MQVILFHERLKKFKTSSIEVENDFIVKEFMKK